VDSASDSYAGLRKGEHLMNQWLWWVSLLVFVLTWVAVSGLLTRAYASRCSSEREAFELQVMSWPRALRRLAWMSFSWRRITRQLSRESVPIRSALRVLAAPSGLTDIFFAQMQLAMLFWALTIGGLLLVTGQWLGAGWGWGVGLVVLVVFAAMAFLLPRLKLFELLHQARREVGRVLPNFLDVLALTLESGQNFQSAIQMAVQRLPDAHGRPGLRGQLQEVLRNMRSGDSRTEALQKWSDRLAMPEVTQFVASMIAADRQGVSVVGLLRRQSHQLRISRALAAERHAMKMPVKLLAPLAICIFPCTFLILAFPLAIRLSQSGLF